MIPGSVVMIRFVYQSRHHEADARDHPEEAPRVPARFASVRPAFPADSGTDERAGPDPAGDRPADDRSPRSRVRARLTLEILDGLKAVFQRRARWIIYPASGTGAWEAALVNTLSPGDRVLMFETGHFATLWRALAEKLSIVVDFVPGDWRSGVDPAVVEAKLAEDRAHAIKGVLVVHNETSTGVTSRIPPIRRAIDRATHPALLMVDSISSLGSVDYRHAEWGVDVTVAGSQKGLMLPPGLSFNAVSEKAIAASRPRGCRARTGAGTR